MSFALVSYYLPAAGHSAKKKRGRNKSQCRENGGCLFVQCARLGQQERNVERSQAAVRGGKNELVWVPSAPRGPQNWMLKVTSRNFLLL